jgi:hypothetical protein
VPVAAHQFAAGRARPHTCEQFILFGRQHRVLLFALDDESGVFVVPPVNRLSMISD